MLVSEHDSHINLIFLTTEVLTLKLVILEGSKVLKYLCIAHSISLLLTNKLLGSAAPCKSHQFNIVFNKNLA